MLLLYYYRWEGSQEDHQKFINQMKGLIDEREGIELKGFYITSQLLPSRVLLIKTDSEVKSREVYKKYIQTFGFPPQITMAGTEFLYKPEDIGL